MLMPILKETLEIYVVRFTDSELADAFKSRESLVFKAENGVEITLVLQSRTESNDPDIPTEYSGTLTRTTVPNQAEGGPIKFSNELRFLPRQNGVDLLVTIP